jgi:hypothetical protein
MDSEEEASVEEIKLADDEEISISDLLERVREKRQNRERTASQAESVPGNADYLAYAKHKALRRGVEFDPLAEELLHAFVIQATGFFFVFFVCCIDASTHSDANVLYAVH